MALVDHTYPVIICKLYEFESYLIVKFWADEAGISSLLLLFFVFFNGEND